MELPRVRGWVRPPVDIPIFGLSGWTGPRWVLIYQGKTRLEELRLAFGEVNREGDKRLWVDVTTYAKLPRIDHGYGAFTVATSFAGVASGTLSLLPERAVASLPLKRRAKERSKLVRRLVSEGAMTLMSEELSIAFWTPVELTIDGTETPGFMATLPDCWAVCADAGEVYLAVTGNGVAPATVALSTISDLRPYRMPGLPE